MNLLQAVFVISVALLSASLARADDDAQGRLIVQKVLTTEFPGLYAVNKNINVTLNVYNVGAG